MITRALMHLCDVLSYRIHIDSRVETSLLWARMFFGAAAVTTPFVHTCGVTLGIPLSGVRAALMHLCDVLPHIPRSRSCVSAALMRAAVVKPSLVHRGNMRQKNAPVRCCICAALVGAGVEPLPSHHVRAFWVPIRQGGSWCCLQRCACTCERGLWIYGRSRVRDHGAFRKHLCRDPQSSGFSTSNLHSPVGLQ